MFPSSRLIVALLSLSSACSFVVLGRVTNASIQTSSLAVRNDLRPDLKRARAAVARLADDTHLAHHRAQASTTKTCRAEAGKSAAADSELSSAARARRERRASRPLASAADARTRDDLRGDKLDRHQASAARNLSPIRPGTSLSRVLHLSQLGLSNGDGSTEEFADTNGDGAADERTTFDTAGGAFDTAVGRTGTRYNVFTAYDNRNGRYTGVLVAGFDTNGDLRRDSSTTFDLRATYDLRSAASVITGTARDGSEFVVVSSVGINAEDSNEPSAGVVLLVRDSFTNTFDARRSRTLVRSGGNDLYNANSLALLPGGDLLIADFGFNEIRIVRDTDGDRVPDTLDAEAYHTFRYSDDAPLEVAANSRGVVFTHSVGNDAPLLAIYDDDDDGYGDADEAVAEGLSIDNNLALHGLTVDREGGVYVVEDAAGADDLPVEGGNSGTGRVIVFRDPSLNGILQDATVYAYADSEKLALSGLAFGDDPQSGVVREVAAVNSASRRGAATFGGLGTLTGAGLTDGATGASTNAARAAGLRVTMEDVEVPVLSFASDNINVYVPPSTTNSDRGVRSVVVRQNGVVRAAGDVVFVRTNPGIFTQDGSGAREAVALLTSGMRYTAAPFPASTNDAPIVVALFGTGWRNTASLTANVGGQAATVEFAGATTFAGLDQLNVRLPAGARGVQNIRITTPDGATSRADVYITVR